MTPTDIRIGDLLFNRLPFVIPKYQRAYAWEQEELDDFVKDLREAWEARVTGKPKSHFFGGLVSVQHAAENAPGRNFEVVDGQQRLATFGLFFALIEQSYRTIALQAATEGDSESKDLANSRAELVRNSYLQYDDEIGGRPVKVLRIVLSKADRDFYDELLNFKKPAPSRASHQRLLDASSRINALVKEVVASSAVRKEQMQRLKYLTDAATEDCHVIHLVSDNKAEAYKLFEVLNDRGRGLTEGDLLRSSTLELLETSPADQAKAEAHWDDILSGKVPQIENFLRAYFASKQGQRAGKRTLFDDFSKAFFPGTPDLAAISARIEDLRREIQLFRKLSEGECPYDPLQVSKWDENRLAILMQILKHELSLPLLLAACGLAQDDFFEIVEMLERFVFRYIVCSHRHAGKLEQVYLAEAAAIRKDPGAYKVAQLRLKLKGLQDAEAPDEVFSPSLQQEMVYRERSGNRIIKYFLTTLEHYLPWYEKGANGQPKCLDQSLVYDLGQVQIEHIYPQNAQTKDPELEELKHKLGNLSFWGPSDNAAAGNANFATKMQSYEQSKVTLNRELENYPKWDKDALAQRENTLVARASKIFAIR